MTSDPAAQPSSQTRDVRAPAALSAPDYSAPAEVALESVTGAESVLIALDFDGVLAPLQDNPDLSRMLPDSARAIADLAVLPGTRVALVSGRDITTLRRLADPPEGVWLVGSHGAEVDLGTAVDAASSSPSPSLPPSSPSSSSSPLSPPSSSSSQLSSPSSTSSSSSSRPEVTDEEQRMLAAIDAHIESFEHDLSSGSASAPGTDAGAGSGTGAESGAVADVRVERKPFSRTVHTRGVDAEFASALHAHVLAVQTEHPGIRVIEGHDITELAVKTATKGDGLRTLIAAGSPSAVLYLGDDVTDEDAFAELENLSTQHRSESSAQQPDDHASAGPGIKTDSSIAAGPSITTGLGIKVGPAPTRAPWRITGPLAVAELLARITTERRTQRPRTS